MSPFEKFSGGGVSKTEALPSRPPNPFDLIKAVREQPIPSIPANEVDFETMRSGGKGGQNVNKVESAARVLWNPLRSRVLTSQQRDYLLLASEVVQKMNTDGQIAIRCDSERDQHRNKALALERLNALVASVLTIEAPRETELKKSVKDRIDRGRLDEKNRGKQTRAARTVGRGDW